jgi:uncharacterized protein YhbP (UPF0306 family)
VNPKELEQVIREYIPPVIHLSLGTSKDNKPWVCEVHFAYDENLNFYFRSLTKTRHCQEIAANPFVSGNIHKEHKLDEMPFGIYFEGTSKLLEPGEEQNSAFACIKERLNKGDDILEMAKDPDSFQFYKISVSNFYIFGKIGENPLQKYTLPWQG